MLKKILILLILLLPLISAQNIILTLTQTEYGPEQVIQGNLLINQTTTISAETILKAITNELTTELTIKQLLINANLESEIIPKNFTISSNLMTSKTLTNDETYIGQELTEAITSFLLKIKGDNAKVLKIDIGDDNTIEYNHKGSIKSWSSKLYPDNKQTYQGTEATKDLFYAACENISISFEEYFDANEIEITAKIAKEIESPSGNVKAYIDKTKVCEFDKTQIKETITDISCIGDLTSPETKTYEICIQADYQEEFYTPTKEDYHFFYAKNAIYDQTLDTEIEIIDPTEINNYLAGCSYQCLVPIKISTQDPTKITITEIKTTNNQGLREQSFYLLDKTEESVELPTTIPLFAFNISTPTEKGDYSLKITLNQKPYTSNFSVITIPIALFTTSSDITMPNKEITLDASSSIPSSGSTITKYEWEFGDNTTSTLQIVSKKYTNPGNYTINLTITDSKGIKSNKINKTIEVLETEEYIESVIDQTEQQLQPIINDFYTQLKYDELRTESLTKLTELRQVLEQAKLTTYPEAYYSNISAEIELIKSQNIISISSSDKLERTNPYREISYFPPTSTQYTTDQKNEINAFNTNEISLKETITRISLTNLNQETSELIVIEKSIYPTDNLIIEDFSNIYSEFSDLEIITPTTYTETNQNTIEFQSSSLVYTLPSGNLENIGITTVLTSTTQENISCGDGICTRPDENEENCPEDCTTEIPWLVYTLLFIILIIGFYYINFYKGPYNFRELSNKLTIKIFNKRLFTNEQDLINLKNYVNQMLKQEHTEEDIKQVLLQQGWNQKQINFAFRK